VLPPSVEAAQYSAAMEACKQLRSIDELDENMMPLGREPPKSHFRSNTATSGVTSQEQNKTEQSVSSSGRPGTTKRRQYYTKQVADSLTEKPASGNEETGDRKREIYWLYAFQMRLTCALPDEQNTRGRKIHPPENAELSFGILVQEKMPPLCQFPIYTRDGEIFVDTVLIQKEVELTQAQKEQVLTFHNYTFSQVLRLEKFPMQYKPNEANSNVLVVPLTNTNGFEVAWNFLETIDYDRCAKLGDVSEEERAAQPFKEEDYVDAVVSPWYRNQDQPQYFYVAEVCNHLSPRSDFPGQGFDTFEKYYKDKYSINVQHLDQPLMDVDHTSARLNFLTPRYVNRKGMSLPTSSDETKKSKRENLEQKQILVPELCAIHPFPASLWRQAVCLPCILYRLNVQFILSLLLYGDKQSACHAYSTGLIVYWWLIHLED